MKRAADGRIFFIDHSIVYNLNYLQQVNNLAVFLETKSTQWEDPRLQAANKPTNVRRGYNTGK